MFHSYLMNMRLIVRFRTIYKAVQRKACYLKFVKSSQDVTSGVIPLAPDH